MDECLCGLDGEWTACVDGRIYVPCDDERCGGCCEFTGTCDCACHERGAHADKIPDGTLRPSDLPEWELKLLEEQARREGQP